jgi:hypothetical protein
MAVFENVSSLPEDRFVNTFYFTRDNSITNAEVANVVTQFYNDTSLGGDNPISYYMSNAINRDTDVCQVRIYDLAQAEPREADVHQWSLGAAGTMGQLPNECACVASFYGDRNLPRSRGRIYVGPLAANAGIADGGDVRVAPGLRTAIANACQTMAAYVLPQWVQRSTVNGALHVVTAGWVDNAFDTQRRRGQKATTRTTWPAPVV